MPRAKRQPGAATNGQPIRTTTGGSYGQRKALEDSQRAMPLQDRTQQPTPSAGPSNDPARIAQTLAAAQNFQPPSIGLGAPSSRPGEPVTAGIGAPSLMDRSLTPLEKLKAIYAKTRNPDVMDLIILIEGRPQ